MQRGGAADARAAMESIYYDLQDGSDKNGAERWERALGGNVALMNCVKVALGDVDEREAAERVQRLYRSLSNYVHVSLTPEQMKADKLYVVIPDGLLETEAALLKCILNQFGFPVDD